MLRFLVLFFLATHFLSALADETVSDTFSNGKVLGNITLFASARFHQSSSLGPNQNKEQTQLLTMTGPDQTLLLFLNLSLRIIIKAEL